MGDARALYQDLLEAAVQPSPVAIEATWDGDTHGWLVDLSAVVRTAEGYGARVLRVCSGGGDIRLFNGHVPPWPGAVEAAELGQRLADELGVPFHFPSPREPEDDCPHWWERSLATPCARCGIALLQRPPCPWQGVCYRCHPAMERGAREALLTPEERAGPRCHLCGKPAAQSNDKPPMCPACTDAYRELRCRQCGSTSLMLKTSCVEDLCGTCEIKNRIAALSEVQRAEILRAAGDGWIAGIIAARGAMGCGIGDAEHALTLLGIERRRT